MGEGRGEATVERCLDRGPCPPPALARGLRCDPGGGQALGRAGKGPTLDWLLDGRSKKLVGPTPRVEGRALDPGNEWGHDVLWWLDRMVRSQRPLDEKLTLFWHDHFATTDQETPLMLRQNQLLRSRGLGRFPDLLRGVTTDWAMPRALPRLKALGLRDCSGRRFRHGGSWGRVSRFMWFCRESCLGGGVGGSWGAAELRGA